MGQGEADISLYDDGGLPKQPSLDPEDAINLVTRCLLGWKKVPSCSKRYS